MTRNLISDKVYSDCEDAYEKFVLSKAYRDLQKSSKRIRLDLNHNHSLFHSGYTGLSTRLLYGTDGTVEIENKKQINPRHEKLKYDLRKEEYKEAFSDTTNFVNQLVQKKKVSGIFIEKIAGLYYMFTLAKFISDTDTNLVIPSTNDPLYERLAFFTSATISPGLRILLDKCLPVPNKNIPMKTIVQFKRKRKTELLQLRKKLQELQSVASEAQSSEEIKEIILNFKEALAIEISTVNRVLIEDRISFAFESMSSLLSLSYPALLSSLLAAGIIASKIDPALGLGIGGVGVVGEIITRYIAKQKTKQTTELSYLFSAKKEGIIDW